MHVVDFVRRHPIVYHMAEDGSWASIQKHGLLSTRALVDLFDPPQDVRDAVMKQVRRRSIILEHPRHGTVRARDQVPLKFLEQLLTADTTPQEFLDALNGRIFFWVTQRRLNRLLNARLYRNDKHLVLQIDTAALLEAYGDVAELAPYNTGALTMPTLPRRGKTVFTPLAAYPYDEWARKRGKNQDAAVELTIPNAVPDLARFVLCAETWFQGNVVEVLVPRAGT